MRPIRVLSFLPKRMWTVLVTGLHNSRTTNLKLSTKPVLFTVTSAAALFFILRIAFIHLSEQNDHEVSDNLSHLLPTDQDIFDIIATVSNGSRVFSETKLQLFLHKFAQQRTVRCDIMKRFGNVRDGGYEICLDPPFTPQQNQCIVYSFGINYDFSFDDAVNAEFNCHVHSFDPSMVEERIPKFHKARNRVTFHPVGLFSADFVRDDGWVFKGFTSIKQMLGHSQMIIDVVKIDIELWEWPVLRDIIVSGEFRFIKALLIEIHTPQTKEPVRFMNYLNILRPLIALEKVGFRKFMFHARNDCCSSYQPMVFENIAHGKKLCCYELFYVNSNFYSGAQTSHLQQSLLERLSAFEQLHFSDDDVERYKITGSH